MKVNQHITLPKNPLPIVIIGAGGIVKSAHLPAYTKANFKVLGIFDIDINKANALKNEFDCIENVYQNLDTLILDAKLNNAVFDIAVPANFYLEILKKLPEKAAVLLQKPMGETLAQAQQLLKLCEAKQFQSAVNFQLRYAPYILAAKSIIDQGLIGEVYDMELKVCVYTPWHLWEFLYTLPRVEILYHSIHYLDLMRFFLGNPTTVYASTLKHPKMQALASTRSTIILNYNNQLQASIVTNHGHEFGKKHQQSYLKIEGTKGAILIRIGLSMNYPIGVPDKFEYQILNNTSKKWKTLKLKGSWFPDAFIGVMASLQNYVLGITNTLPHNTKDAYNTMQLVETAYQSSETEGTPFKINN